MTGPSGWVLRPAAEQDLMQIWRDGAGRWGVEQADRCADAMFAIFDLLVAFPELARERTEFQPPVRIHPANAHLVIYRLDRGAVDIIRVLHAHQNLTAFLQTE